MAGNAGDAQALVAPTVMVPCAVEKNRNACRLARRAKQIAARKAFSTGDGKEEPHRDGAKKAQ